MDERVVQARVGIMVVSSLLLTAILVVLFGDFPKLFQDAKQIQIRFPTAPGVTEGTPVRKSGILVGRVASVKFDDESSDVLVTVDLDDKSQIRENEVCRIASETLFGDAVLEFVPGPETSGPPIPAGAQLKGQVGGNPIDILVNLEGDIRSMVRSVTTASDEFGQLSGQVNRLLGDPDNQQLQRLGSKSELALDEFRLTMQNINDVLGPAESRDALRKTLAEMPQLLENTGMAVDEMRSAVARADHNLRNLEGLTGPLGERGEEITQRVDSSITKFDEVMGQLVSFTEQMNSNQGTLGRLMNDPELYDNLNSAISGFKRLSTEVRPIVSDLRVFSDKIARDPGRLGVSGALHREDRSKFPNFKLDQPAPLQWREDLRPPDHWQDEY